MTLVFAEYKSRMGLLGHGVWSADELRVFLEQAPTIRQSYAAWITPSDILAEVLRELKRPNLERLLPLALARDLRSERDVRLRDAGQETEKPMYLEEIFIDLPMTARASDVGRKAAPQKMKDDEREQGPDRIATQLLMRAADKLDPSTLEIQVNAISSEMDQRQAYPNRVVILGGPGQGKSTLGQFLAQVMRAKVLSTRPSSTLNPPVRDMISLILRRAKAAGIWLDGPIRFPIMNRFTTLRGRS